MEGIGDCARQRACSMTADDLPLIAAEHPGIGEHEHAAPVLTSDRGDLPYCRVNQRDVLERPNKDLLPLELLAVESAHCSGQPFRLANEHASGAGEKKLGIKDFFASSSVLGYPRVHPAALQLRQLGERVEIHAASVSVA